MFFYRTRQRDRSEADAGRGPLPWKAAGRRGAIRTMLSASPAASGSDPSPAGLILPAGGGRAIVAPGETDPQADDLAARIGTASIAFRGYDTSPLGRSPELLAHPAYGPTVRRWLDAASAIAAETLKRPIDLAGRVETRAESNLGSFAEDVAMIVAMELAQVDLLEQFFGVKFGDAKQAFGYSVGEMSAVVAAGVFSLEQLLPVPLGCADDCAELAADVTLGILFSRGPEIPFDGAVDLCNAVSGEGHGLVGVSSYLSPNTLLVMGQGETLRRVEEVMSDFLPPETTLRRKSTKLPPLHTPLVWQKNIPNRAATALYRIAGAPKAPSTQLLSCATGAAAYEAREARDTLIRWVDQPQRVWDVVYETLVSGVDLVVHAGPAPNLLPATFERLSNNVERQFSNRYMKMIGRHLGSRIRRHGWLARRLPTSAALMRAPHVAHVVLEDWLLARRVA